MSIDHLLGERKRQKIAELEAKLRSVQSESIESSSPEQSNPIESTTQPAPGTRQPTQANLTEVAAVLLPVLQSDAQPFAAQPAIAPLLDPQLSVWSTIPQDQPIDFQLSSGYITSATAFSGLSASIVQDSRPTSLPTPSGSDDSTPLLDGISSANGTGNFQFLACQETFPISSADGESSLLQQSTLAGRYDAFLGTADIPPLATDSDSNDTSQHCASPSPTAVMAWQSSDSSRPSPSTMMNTAQSGPSFTPGAMNDVWSLDVPVLKVIRAGKRIADMFDCSHHMWNPFFQHVVRIQPPDLPPHFKPTRAQLHIPHHPIFDVIPWASARTKFICILSQPMEMRPPSARDPLAIVNLLMDIDDESEGMRIHGEDGWDSKNWEVGEKFFRNWWWALDREIVANSNKLRAQRGAGRLRLTDA